LSKQQAKILVHILLFLKSTGDGVAGLMRETAFWLTSRT